MKRGKRNDCTKDLQYKRASVKKIEIFSMAECTIKGSVREYGEVAKIVKYER